MLNIVESNDIPTSLWDGYKLFHAYKTQWKGIFDRMDNLSLGYQTQESDHKTLGIELKCTIGLEHVKFNHIYIQSQ